MVQKQPRMVEKTAMKIPVLVTGMSGLVGTRVKDLLSGEFDFTDLSLATGVNIVNFEDVENKLRESDAKIIIHMAAKTDVDACEDDKILGEDGDAWQINVIGTNNVVLASENTGKRLIYISTDFVFNGTKDFYTENDDPDPLNWYGRTKYEAEEIVMKSKVESVILRLAYPYRSYFQERSDFVRRIITKAKDTGEVEGLEDHIFTPTFIDDIAEVLRFVIYRNVSGIYHSVGSLSLPVIEAVNKILSTFGLEARVKRVIRNEYFLNRAYRPFKLALKNDKIKRLGIEMKRFDDGLLE